MENNQYYQSPESNPNPAPVPGPAYQNNPNAFSNQPRTTNGMATASLILGIASLLLVCCGGVPGIVLGALGLTFAFLSRENGKMFTIAKVGLGLSTGGLVLGIIAIFCCIVAFRSPVFQEEFMKQFNESYQEFYGDYEDGSGNTREFDSFDDYLNEIYEDSMNGSSQEF